MFTAAPTLLPAAVAVRQLFYISRAMAQPQQLQPLLERARQHNAAVGLTGALLFTGGHFAQLLEGPEEALRALVSKIECDDRHDRMSMLLDRPSPSRHFASWSMALVEAPGADDLIEQLLAHPCVSPERAERLIQLMFDRLPDTSSADR